MMVMTAKVNPKKVLTLTVLVCLLIVGLILLTGRKAASASATESDSRVQFLKDFGWEVKLTPKESGQVRVPDKASAVFERYNALQLSQGYNLEKYAGKRVMRYVYEVTNYPGSAEPVYATLLVYKDKIIGGDITDTAVKGKIHGFRMPQAAVPETEPSIPDTTAEDAQG